MTSAAAIASQVRTGRRSAVDVVAHAVDAARSSHESLNGFTLIDVDGAMRRAEGIDRLVADGRDPGPLAGVPIALKDLIDDAGMPNRLGASFPADAATTSATVVRRLGAAGAVIVGRTGLHEFAFGFTSENHWFGPVRNPWNRDHSAGGSSGGSGAAVAAGITPIGIGTDTGGSVRVPAAMCGVMGLKVTHGRIPLTGVYPLVPSIDTVGPIARTVTDLELAYRAMAGDDPEDPWSRPVPLDPPESPRPSEVRLAVVDQWLAPPTSSDIRAGLERFIEACGALGIEVDHCDVPSLEPTPELVPAIGPEVMSIHGDRLARHPDRYGPDTAARIESVRHGDAGAVLAAERWGSAASATIERMVQDGYAAVVCPTVGVLHKVIGVDDVDVDGSPVQHREALARFTSPINRMRVPALAAPVAGTPEPGVSIQLVGPRWSESRLLAVGRLLEESGVIEARTPPVFFG